ncbi:hypothetical protein GCK32_013754 [Trichostrongylus colubriformis]|uniref:Uncharacterized protein n=1 Tax=Trichostrongylus colubriformis TaxID=6319 RepID=A0AAN8FK22_TRICO
MLLSCVLSLALIITFHIGMVSSKLMTTLQGNDRSDATDTERSASLPVDNKAPYSYAEEKYRNQTKRMKEILEKYPYVVYNGSATDLMREEIIAPLE